MGLKVTCPICSGSHFVAQGARSTARCATCQSLERGRLCWLVMQRLGCMHPGQKILNVAPEHFMLTEGLKVFTSAGYFGCDYDPSQWDKVKYGYQVHPIDLCGNLAELGGRSFDIIMHNHVLEHVPCSVRVTLHRLNTVLRSGGLHLFSIPISPQSKTEEDLSPTLRPSERFARFGQQDHMRVFGGQDFLTQHVPPEMDSFIDLHTILNEIDLASHGIPLDALNALNSHHIFAWRKPARL
jgi:hypothetical protein